MILIMIIIITDPCLNSSTYPLYWDLKFNNDYLWQTYFNAMKGMFKWNTINADFDHHIFGRGIKKDFYSLQFL